MNFLVFGLDVPKQSSFPGSLCYKESKYTSCKSMCSEHMHSNRQPGHLQDNLSLLFCRLTIGLNVSIFYRKKTNLLKYIEGEKRLLKFLVLKKNYKMIGNSENAVKTVKPLKFTLHQLSFLSLLAFASVASRVLDHGFDRAFFCHIWILFPFRITPTPPFYAPPPHTFLSICVFFDLLQT